MNIGFNELGIEAKRQVLYRNFHQVGDKIYLVEISRNPKKVFILLFPNFEKPEEFLSESMTEKQAVKLMNENGNIFENFVKQFYVKFGKLQIDGYHGKGGFRNHKSVQPRVGVTSIVPNSFTDNQSYVPRSSVVQSHAYGNASARAPPNAGFNVLPPVKEAHYQKSKHKSPDSRQSHGSGHVTPNLGLQEEGLAQDPMHASNATFAELEDTQAATY